MILSEEVHNYAALEVSAKTISLIQSYSDIVNKNIWQKHKLMRGD